MTKHLIRLHNECLCCDVPFFAHKIVQFVSSNNPSYLIIIKIAIYFLIILCIIFELTLITQLLKLYYKPIKSSNFMKETVVFLLVS